MDGKGGIFPLGRAPSMDNLETRLARLLPTPRASENENRQTRRSPSQQAGRHGLNLAAEVASLLPTPKATDGTKGGPNQHGSSGDLMLPSAVARLLPTPKASDTGTAGRRASPGFRPPLSEVLLPLLPTSTASAYGSNQSPTPGAALRPSMDSMARPGVPTARRSAAGRPPSDGPHPGQLTIEDASPPPSSNG